jgi:putative peptidoglycan lipid II flippase
MSKSILKSSLVMAAATFCSRILGLVREQIMAAYFGASGLTDAFLVAYRIPNLLRDLLAEGAFSSAFVPTFTEANQESPDEGRRLLWELFFILGAITGVISVLIFAFAPEIIALFAPSFVADPHKFEITVTLTRIMCPFLFFISLAALFMGALNSLRVFFIPALAPAAYNVMSILAMLFLTGWLHSQGYEPVLSLGWGAMFGGFVQAAVQVPLLFRRGYAPRWPTMFGSKRAKKVMLLIGPGLIGFAATQINLLVNTILATSSAVGATSWLNYAFRLFQLPVGILSVSIGNSNLVHFSAAWKKGEREEALRSLSTSYYLSFLSVVPAMALLYTLSDEVVRLIFERGRFTAESTAMTAVALRMYVLGLPLYSLYKIWVPTFYALDRQRVAVWSSLLSVGLNIAFCSFMAPRYGFAMLALGTTLSMLLNCLILGVRLKQHLSLPVGFFVSPRLLKLLFAGVLLAVSVEKFSEFWTAAGTSALSQFVYLAVLGGAGTLVFTLALLAMGERDAALSLVRRIVNRGKKG